MSKSLAQKVLEALPSLVQFSAAMAVEDGVVHALTGMRVTASGDTDEDDEFLTVHPPGGAPYQVLAALYFNLQIVEHVRFELAMEDGRGAEHHRVTELHRHLAAKFGI